MTIRLQSVIPEIRLRAVSSLTGPKGDAATISVGSVTTLAPGESATVTNAGTATAAVLNFGIPQGDDGTAATVAVGDVTTVAPGDPATVTNVGTSNAAEFDFEIPQGAAATITVGTVTTVDPNDPATVTNVGTSGAAVFDFEIPKGDPGAGSGNVNTGTAPVTNGNLVQYTGTSGNTIDDSGISSSTVATASSTTTFTNKTFDANGTGNSISNIETADIASGSKTGADSDLVTGTAGSNGDVVVWNGDGDAVSGGAAPLLVGKHTIWVPAASMIPALTSGPATNQVESSSNDSNLVVLDFDASADEHANFCITMPKGWNEGTVTFQVWWRSTATDTDGVAWGLQAHAVSDGDVLDGSWGTAVVVTDDAQSTADDILVTAESSAVTVGGTPAEGDLCMFRIFRDVSDANDDMTEDARLVGLKLFITYNAGNDA